MVLIGPAHRRRRFFFLVRDVQTGVTQRVEYKNLTDNAANRPARLSPVALAVYSARHELSLA